MSSLAPWQLVLLGLVGPQGGQEVVGTVVDGQGVPIQGVAVFAADAETDAVVTIASSDVAGRVQLSIPNRRHNFGVLSPRLGVDRLVPAGPRRFTLVLRPVPPDPRAAGGGKGAAMPSGAGAQGNEEGKADVQVRAGRAVVIRGRVTDEAGRGLPGVRVEGLRPTGAVVAVVLSGPQGRFVLPLPGGDSRVSAYAPGLVLVRSVSPPEGLAPTDRPKPVTLVMGIASGVQNIVVTTGRVVRIRPQDSIDPEYSPPAAVRTWLLFAYGICAQTSPMTVAQKQRLKKYWYLDVLRMAPPNPASIATANCAPPSIYDQLPLTVTAGFDALVGFEPPPEEWVPKP